MKHCMQYFLLIFIFLATHQVFSQEENVIQLDGYVMYDTLRSVPFSHIIVKNTYRGTICDFWGYYSFAVKTNDTLLISSVGYKTKSFVIPNQIESDHKTYNFRLEKDTIMLQQVDIFPWKNFEQFKTVFINTKIPEDDIDRARKNFAILKKQMQYQDYISDASLNYKYYLKQQYDQLYWKGQTRPLSIFNVFAWAEFFKAINEGKFKQKEEEDFDFGY